VLFGASHPKLLTFVYETLQLDINLERLRMAVDSLILKLAKLFPRPKQQMVFLINNYDMTIAVLKVSRRTLGSLMFKCTHVDH